MASTAAERKAAETKRKAEQGLKRKSFWLSEDEFKIIENFKQSNNLKTNDEALQQILKALTWGFFKLHIPLNFIYFRLNQNLNFHTLFRIAIKSKVWIILIETVIIMNPNTILAHKIGMIFFNFQIKYLST